MKRTILLLWLFTICFSAIRSDALTIPASEDSWSYNGQNDKLTLSGNNANSLVVDAKRRAYLYFNLGDVPSSAVVRWAKLRLFLPVVQRAGNGLSVHSVTSEWNESKASSLPTVSTGTLGIITPDKMASRRFVTVDVTSTVQLWISGGTLNEGFAVQPIVKAGNQTASVMLTSKEGPVFGLPAELDIEFQPEGGVDKPVTLDQLPSEIRGLLTPTINSLPLSLRTFLSPAITSQPVSPASPWSGLSVQAQGLGNLSYKWMRNGVVVNGGTSAYLPVGSLQSGTYTVAVSNGFATVLSEEIQFSEPTFTDLFAFVTGGTLPASSQLGAVPVETFYIDKTEVTWSEWQTVRAWAVEHGYHDLAGVGQGVGDNYPVTDVNWYDVVKWCNARSEKEGKTPVYQLGGGVYKIGQSEATLNASSNGYRLPSHAEWEFAARGGTQTHGYTHSGSNDLDAVGWYVDNSGSVVHEVGGKQANELGISDMSGNVWEWSGFEQIRGGAWNYAAEPIRGLNGYAADHRNHHGQDFGFRVATSGEYALGITAQPSVSLDGTTLSVEAAGSGTLTYQWRLNAVAIAGGTSSQLSTQGLQSGTYTVVVSNGLSSKFSEGIQYQSPIDTFALVGGGTLPASSPLGAMPVETFYIGKTEVTWKEWVTVRDWAVVNGYDDLAGVGQGVGDNYPVTDLNWYDVVKWCNACSEKEGKTPVYKNATDVYRTGVVANPQVLASANGYRLPQEHEWEWAARGGTKTKGYTYSGSDNLDEVGWYAGNSGGAVHEVGKKQANELGIYDMSGNLWEWCGSWYSGYEGSFRVIRGGSWYGNAGRCSVAYRSYSSPEYRDYYRGFRVALSSVP